MALELQAIGDLDFTLGGHDKGSVLYVFECFFCSFFENDGQRKYFSLLFRQTHKYQHPVENGMNAPL